MILIDTVHVEPIRTTVFSNLVESSQYAKEEMSRITGITGMTEPYVPLGICMTGLVGYVTKDIWFPYVYQSSSYVIELVKRSTSRIVYAVKTLAGTLIAYVQYIYDTLGGDPSGKGFPTIKRVSFEEVETPHPDSPVFLNSK